jgi:hypothetical protein
MVTIQVNGTSNTLSHKGSMGIAKNTMPDVCKTPSPGGPVPIPYPVIISMSSDLANGTTTVKADGGNMIAVKGSEFSRCTGDEPGTAGGVKSSTNMKEAKWILYSFDVKMDGKNACRKTDKMTMNHANTVCLAGEDQIDKFAQALKIVAQACDDAVNKAWDDANPKGPKHNECHKGVPGETGNNPSTGVEEPKPVRIKLGELKEQCVNDNVPDTAILKKQQNFDKDGVPRSHPTRGGARPDFILHGPGGLTDVIAVFDLKFPCPSEAKKPGQWRPGQAENYRRIFKVEPRLVFP